MNAAHAINSAAIDAIVHFTGDRDQATCIVRVLRRQQLLASAPAWTDGSAHALARGAGLTRGTAAAKEAAPTSQLSSP